MRIAHVSMPRVGVFFGSDGVGGTPAVNVLAGGGYTTALAGARKGILSHAEHVADLVLDIAPGNERGELPGLDLFEGFVRRFLDQIEAREIDVLNEKFDGSPALLLGFDKDNHPFVAYKRGIGGSRGSRIVRTVKEAKALFKGSPFGNILEDCIRHVRRRLVAFKDKGLMFQADLLFTPRNGSMTVDDDAVRIRANQFGIEYTLPCGSTFYEFAARSKIGLVVHTVMGRIIDEETGEVQEGEPIENADFVEQFVKTLRSETVFVIDPWSRRVQIDRGDDTFSVEKRREIENILREMRDGLSMLGPDFRGRWRAFLPHFKTFLNSSLKAGKSGGIYRAAASDEEFDFDLIVEKFRSWIAKRSETIRISPKGSKSRLAPKKMPCEFEEQIGRHGRELYRYFKAYYDANRILYLLKPHMKEAYSSKLGGGRIEGIMVTDDVTHVKVKLVDRLDFTMQNFSGEKERVLAKRSGRARHKSKPLAKKKVRIPQPYRKWRGGVGGDISVGAAFFLGKLQPPHAGHIALIGAAIEQLGLEAVFIMPSDKAPDLLAKHWSELGVAAHKKDLVEGCYTHVFSQELREEMLRRGLPQGVHIHFADTRTFWSYLSRAKIKNRRGRVALIMGRKELEEGRYLRELERYADNLVAYPVKMQQDGLSATQVRQAIRSLHRNGDIDSYEFLCSAFAFITPTKERDCIIGRLISQWADVEAAVSRLI